jgi:hypothetical protein
MSKVITANINGDFYGGLPFSVNWSFNGADSPSKLTVSVVNEEGNYADPSGGLGFGSSESIQIGGFTFVGYLVSYEFKNTPNQKTLDLTYVDLGINLDRYYVGLHNRYGRVDDTSAANLIIVGKAYHPCDQNLDSTVSYSEVEGEVDPCDPCPKMPPDKYENSCNEVLSEFKIFEVYYTFNELISAIGNVIDTSFDGSSYTNYRSQHTGTIREVLSAWCSDLGLAFFWDPIASRLEIVNRSTKIDIPSQSALEGGEDLINLDYGGSVENTFTQGSIGFFARESSIEDYSCTNSTLENLRSLTLGDLAADGKFTGSEPAAAQSSADGFEKLYQAKELAVCLSYYSSTMRDALIWFHVNKIYKGEDLKKYIGEEPDENNSLYGLFGNLEILAVYDNASDDQEERATFTDINDLISDNESLINVLNAQISGDDPGTDENPNYYFFIARCNEDIYEKSKERERELAQSFFGKYWFIDYKTTIPNTSNSTTQVTVEAPEGSGGWYFKNSQIKNLSVFDFGHEEGSFISTLNDKIAESEDAYDQYMEQFVSSDEEEEFIVDSFILWEREPKWFPPQEDARWYQSLFDWYSDQIPRKFVQGDGRPEKLFEIWEDAKNDGSIRLYIARKGKEEVYQIKQELSSINDHEKENRRKRPVKIDVEQNILGEVDVREISDWGFGDENKFVQLTIGSEDMIIFTPIGGFEQTSEESQTGEDKILYKDDEKVEGYGTGYDVVAKAQSNFKVFFPKVQFINQYTAQDVNSAANISYHFEDIAEENLNVFRPNRGGAFNGVRNRKNCKVSKSEVDAYMSRASEFTRYKMTDTQNRASMRFAGAFPVNYGIFDGLSAVSISVDDNGVYTDYVLEDKIIKPPSISVLQQFLRNYKPIKPQKSGGSINPVTKQDLRRVQNSIQNYDSTPGPS